MIELRFSGWFQCRLATDPDPHDEPRGVSGYVHAYVGEPDLDRILHLQSPPFRRSFAPTVGVRVDQVRRDGQLAPDHPLLGATVDLLGRPMFEGRNGVIADDGFEPIHPFEFAIVKDGFRVVRSVTPADPDFPFPEFFAQGVEPAGDEIREATGIDDLRPLWSQRRDDLRAQLDTLIEPERTGTSERVAFLTSQLAAGGGAARFFLARMRYDYPLTSVPELIDPSGWLPEATGAHTPWPCRFWLGGWDADTLCGFVRGTLTIDPLPTTLNRSGRVARATDRRP